MLSRKYNLISARHMTRSKYSVGQNGEVGVRRVACQQGGTMTGTSLNEWIPRYMIPGFTLEFLGRVGSFEPEQPQKMFPDVLIMIWDVLGEPAGFISHSW